MSIYKLCPFCPNNATCKPPVPINVVVGTEEATRESADLTVSLHGGIIDKRTVCSAIEEALNMAIERKAERLSFTISTYVTADEALIMGTVINCRTILQLNHKAAGFDLKEIRLACNEDQAEQLKAGLARSHPLCLDCFEKSCVQIGG